VPSAGTVTFQAELRSAQVLIAPGADASARFLRRTSLSSKRQEPCKFLQFCGASRELVSYKEWQTWQPCKRSLRPGNKVITCRRAAGRHSRGLPSPITTWPGRVPRSWSKPKLQPNELNRRTSSAAPGAPLDRPNNPWRSNADGPVKATRVSPCVRLLRAVACTESQPRSREKGLRNVTRRGSCTSTFILIT